MTDEILTRLLTGEIISGQALSDELHVTRAAVWKQIEQLRAAGFVIESVGRQGYRLTDLPDSIMPPVIRQQLQSVWAGCEIVYFPTIDSTNKYARQLAEQGAPQGTLVAADEQTAGRGRRGRGWISPSGESLAMTLILRPEGHPSQVARLSLMTALAVAKAIARVTALDCRIKWPNDIVCQGRKLCGLLLEMSADESSVHYVVAGVGVNVHQKEFPQEIALSAGSLDLLTGRSIRRADIIRAFLEEFEAAMALDAAGGDAFMAEYRAWSATLGQRVQVAAIGETFVGTAQRVTSDGALVVRTDDGEERTVLAADVSVRGLMGYAE